MNGWHKHQRPVGAMRAAALGVEERTPCATCHYPDCCCAQLAIEEDLAYITQGPDPKWTDGIDTSEAPFAPRLAEWADIQPGAVTVFSCGPPCKVTAVTENEFRRLCPRTGQDVFGSKAAVQRGQYTLLAPAPEAFVPRTALAEDIQPGAVVRYTESENAAVVIELRRYDGSFACPCGWTGHVDYAAHYTLMKPAPEAFVPRIATEEDMVQGAIVRDRCANYDEVVGYRDGDSWAASWADEDGVVDGCSIPASAVRDGRLTLVKPAPAGEPAPPPEGFKVSPERFKATTFDFGNGPVPAHRHSKGGGWVADTATVADTAFVGPNARVFGKAQVDDSAQVSNSARVFGTAQVRNTAEVSGTACVVDDAQVRGDAWIYGNAMVGGCAVVCVTARIGGDTHVVNGTHTGAL